MRTSGRDRGDKLRIAVIGAGASGLTAAKALREVGLTPVIYEEATEVGGLWVYREHQDHRGPAYRSLRTNTSKQITAFSDVPFPDHVPDFPSRSVVETYLRNYATEDGLLPLIRFRSRVRRVLPAGGRQWRLTVRTEGVDTTETFDAVLVCTGIFREPVIPSIAGQENFAGEMLHSIDYRVPDALAGRDVLVVGLGSSAADIAIDLLLSANHVMVSTRRGVWAAPRTLGGRPLDHHGTRLSYLLPEPLRAQRRRQWLAREYARHGISGPSALWQRANVPFAPDTAPSVTSDDLLPHIGSDQIDIRPAIACFHDSDVVFANGSRARPDTVIYGTGYDLEFPFLPFLRRPWHDAASGLYRLVFSPDHPTLAFIGVCRAQGPVFPIVEMQARWAARILSGEVQLPGPDVMRAEVAERWRVQMARHDSPIRVSLIPYLDELGAIIGVQPRLWRHPSLLMSLLTGPPVAAQYRLDGSNRWEGAPAAMRAASGS